MTLERSQMELQSAIEDSPVVVVCIRGRAVHNTPLTPEAVNCSRCERGRVHARRQIFQEDRNFRL